ncbi:filamentous haemagglutinin family protein [Ideonella sp.]|uniref:filamentous haemagglutinin family protein n=1 Tax=Ideonella sp. TaxID=1929293 RepID=UPI0035AF9152
MTRRPTASARHTRCAGRRHLHARLSPLVAALAACWPLWVAGQSRPPIAPPPPNTVPVPAVSWRVYGSGSAAPVNTPNPNGGIDQTIRQDSQRAIYQWQSFDIGANSSVTFDMVQANSAALNRVFSGSPSRIFGKLNATNGGEIYLINANGILFGRGAQVNTGALVASGLNISDNEFLSGLTNHLLYDRTNPAFRYDGAAADFVDAKNFVRVDEGATITTTNGGRVFLFAKRVENAGTITTPGGQTMLAAGGEIYLQQPSDNPLYASEANPDVPALRGLLVEVGAGPAGAPEGVHGSAVNEATGVISTPRGNATIVAMAVNQMGRITATTSVTENGSIILRAQGAAQALNEGVRATEAGALVLGEGSLTEITPDDGTAGNGGEPLTSDGNAVFVAPRIDLAGRSVLLDRHAKVVAPGAIVDIRAEAVPNTQPGDGRGYTGDGTGDGSGDQRIVLADGALIDVSGTTDTTESVERWFVTTGLLGSNDLRDAPLQQDGLLWRSRVTLDVRDDSAMLGSLESYRDGLQQTIGERLSAGGTVRMTAGSGVLTHANSRIDVSGGQVTYTGAYVRETQLIGADGQLYSLTDAPADLVYTGAVNLQKGGAAGFDRWGVKVNYGNLSPARYEAGYTEGRAAGSVQIVAPTVVLDGQMDAHVIQGERQQRGDDALAVGGSLAIGAVTQNGQDFTSGNYQGGPVLRDFTLSRDGSAVDRDQLWADAMQAMLPASSGMRTGQLEAAGFQQVAVAAEGDVALNAGDPNARLDLGDQASVRLLSQSGDVTVGGTVRSAGGSVELNARQGQARLESGGQVQLQGRFVNTLQDGPRPTQATVGGSFSASGGQGVTLAAGSVVDVSGGAVVDEDGRVRGGDAGRIALAHTAAAAGDAPGLVMDGTLRGEALGAAAGGSLGLTAPQIQVGGTPAEPGTLTLDAASLLQGGFASLTLDGRHQLEVAAGSRTELRRDEYRVDPRDAALLASGGDWRDLATAGPAPGVTPAPVSLTLRSSGTDASDGRLVVHEGAVIEGPARSSIHLQAQNQLLMDGELRSAGGNVSLGINARQVTETGQPVSTVLWVGEHARIDVSGTTLLTPTTDGTRQGEVLAGGTITLSAKGASGTQPVLVLQQGAELAARGASAVLDRAELGETGVRWTRAEVASQGGTIAIEAAGPLVSEARLDLHGGRGAAGGTLAVNVTAEPTNLTGSPENERHELRVTEGPTDRTGGVALGDTAGIVQLDTTASVSAQGIRASGAANLTLTARDAVRLMDGVDLDLQGTITVSSRALAMEPGTQSTLQAGQVRLQGYAPLPDGLSAPVPAATGGNGVLDIRSRDGLLVAGDWVTQGIDRLALTAGGDMMLLGPDGNRLQGSLSVAGDVALTARQIYPGTGTDFRLTAGTAEAGRDITIAGQGDSADARTPLSAGGRLTLQAATITQGGVVRAPQGQIVLQASESVTLTDGSVTSVSADGLLLPYGSTVGGQWRGPDDEALDGAPTKRIDIQAPTVEQQEGATLDLSGGGDLVGYEFVPGRGGSNDVFAGGNGAYALVPGVQGAALYDTTLNGAAGFGRQITIGPGGPLPAGTYTLLPARYALQPGAVLIEPVAGGTPLGLGTTVRQADGTVLLGGRLSTAGTGIADARATTWRVSTGAQARERSEIRETRANVHFSEQAAHDGVGVGERPMDAGTLSLTTTRARLDGRIDMAGGTSGSVGGRGGRAEFVADEVVVSADGEAAGDGALHLSVDTLNGLGAQTLVLGARSGVAPADGGDDAPADGLTTLDVQASRVTLDTGGQALQVNDLVLAAQDAVQVVDGSVVVARAPAGAAAPAGLRIEGDGAALRVAAAPGAALVRQGVDMAQGSLQVGAGVRLDAGEGTLVLDATHDTKIAGSARLDAGEITLGSPVIAVGGPAGGTGVLALTPGLLAQVSEADELTLRAYRFINLKDGAVLGEDASGAPTLDRLVLDTATLRTAEATQQGARITAGDITLTNTTGRVGAPTFDGDGRLTLHASQAAGGGGDIHLGEGRVVIQNAATALLAADGAVRLDAEASTLATHGDLTLRADALVAGRAGAEATVQAGGLLRTEANADSTAPASALGAALTLEGERIEHAGRIVLPSGAVTMQAEHGITVAADSRLDVAGRTVAVGEAQVTTDGGDVRLHTVHGDLALRGGSINVSGGGAGTTGGAGGRLALEAPEGAVQLGTDLHGTAGTGAGTPGAEVNVDSAQAVDLAALARALDESDPASFGGAIRLRQREGDLVVGPQTTLAAREIVLAADDGALTVQGTLDARAVEGGRITLASEGALTVGAGAQLLASATSAGGDGGRVWLGAETGTLALREGAVIDVSAGSDTADAGRLTLRAERLGVTDANPGGTGVDIAPIGAAIRGAGRIDVEAVKVYDGVERITDYAPPAHGTLLVGTLASDGLAFVGADGSRAAAIADRLAGGDATVREALRIHAAAEVRGEGDIELHMAGGSWTTPTERAEVALRGGDVSAVGDTSITVRAGGELTVRSSIDMGAHWSGHSRAGGSLTLVAGADLAGAAPTALQAGSDAALTIGRRGATSDVRVRTTTGDITLAAAGDVDLTQGNARVFSTGVVAQDEAAQAVRDALFRPDAFRVEGGDVRVEAGGSVRSRSVFRDDAYYYNAGTLLGVQPGAWQRIDEFGDQVIWDARPDEYGAGLQHGLGAFGGGRIDVRAGRDVVDLTAAAPSSGFLDADGGAHTYGGGSVRVSAGRDVVNGVVQAGGAALVVDAGRDVAWRERPVLTVESSPSPGLLLAHEDTAVRVSGRRDVTVGASTSSHALDGEWISGLAPQASLHVLAAGGALQYRADAELPSAENMGQPTFQLWPGQVTMAAPSGSVTLSGGGSSAPVIQQAESAAVRLDLLAGGSVQVDTDLQVNASWSQGVAHHDSSGSDPLSVDGSGLPGSAWLALEFNDLQRGDGAGLDRSDRTPVRLVAGGGDVTLGGSLRSARPVRLLAAGDIAFTGTNANSGLEVQHQPQRLDGGASVSELSLLRAGGDITLGAAGVRVAGGGDLVLLAGRDIDLGRGAGIQAVGNVDNATRLPTGSAGVTLVAGVRADGADYQAASLRGFGLLGAAGLTKRSADLYALLAAEGGAAPGLGSPEAAAFAALDTAGQLDRVRSLLGPAAYDAAIARYVRGLPGHAGDSDAQAIAAFATLSDVKRGAAPGSLLAEAFGQRDAATRLPFLAAVARADAAASSPAFIGFVQAHTGRTGLSLEQALAAFEALPLERQLLRLNAVLVDEVRTHGRAAVAARLATEKEAAYDRGYAAINSLFAVDAPGRPDGDIRLPTTQVRTLQGSGITMLVPGGSVNAGETGSSTKPASALGVVTVGGGDIAGIAQGDILVNQSRIFTLAEGDILLWSSTGDVDAGRGAKTVVGAPPPVYRLDANGRIVVDTSGSFSGSGIAVLDPDSALDLYAPAGAIDAGEAGIRAVGSVTLGADVIRGADDIVGGSVAGAPPAAPTVGATAALAAAADAATAATRPDDDDEDERRKKRRARRQLLLEFLGFGQG